MAHTNRWFSNLPDVGGRSLARCPRLLLANEIARPISEVAAGKQNLLAKILYSSLRATVFISLDDSDCVEVVVSVYGRLRDPAMGLAK